MAKPPFYVRVFDSSPDGWFVATPDCQKIAKQVFNLKDPSGQSTYRIWDEVEEAAAAAGYMLASDKFDNCHLARFSQTDLFQSGVVASDRVLGYTGIAAIDYRHCDLIGTAEQLKRMLEAAIERLHSGEDVVRSIKKTQLRRQLLRIVSLPVCDRPTHTAHLCEVLLEQRSDADICRDRTQTETELSAIQIPEEAIRLRAYFRWEMSGQPEGTAHVDWCAASHEMRTEYREHFMKNCFR